MNASDNKINYIQITLRIYLNEFPLVKHTPILTHPYP